MGFLFGGGLGAAVGVLALFGAAASARRMPSTLEIGVAAGVGGIAGVAIGALGGTLGRLAVVSTTGDP